MPGVTLVTGATGFIGSHVARQLLEKGERVRVLVRDPAKLADVGLQDLPGLEVARGDLLDPATIPPALEGVTRLHHIAGFISTAPADRKKVYSLNFDITRNLFEVCKTRKLEKIVYLASIFALCGGTKEPATEETPYNLSDLDVDYVKAKRQAELYSYECLQKGLPLVHVYPCFCYGPGDVYNSSSRLVVAFLQRQLPAYVPAGQNAMDVRDAAKGLLLGMEEGRVGSKYLVGGENISYEKLFALLSKITGYGAPKLKLPAFAARAAGSLAEVFSKRPILDHQASLMMERYWYYNDSKARRELGYVTRPLEETLRDAIDWFCEKDWARRPPKMK